MKDERSKKLYDGITHIDDDLIEAAQADTPVRRTRPWVKWAALAACLVIVAVSALTLWPGRSPALEPQQKPGIQEPGNPTEPSGPSAPGKPMASFLAAEAKYPIMVHYPGENATQEEKQAWEASVQAQLDQPAGYQNGLDGFLAWLWDFEFSKLGLPAPDAVLLLDMPERVSSALVKRRSAETGQKLDIHETHGEYLRACRRAASYVASSCGWRVIPCAPEDGEEPYPREVIADRVREALADIL